jgi:hypothetical protein
VEWGNKANHHAIQKDIHLCGFSRLPVCGSAMGPFRAQMNRLSTLAEGYHGEIPLHGGYPEASI